MSEDKMRGQRLAGLFTWDRDGRRGMNGRLELAGRLVVEPGSSVIVAPRKTTVENGPKYDLILMPPDNGNNAATNDKGGNDDIPF